MVTYQVNDMTCGHCASAISRAIAAVDKAARLDIRLHQKLVRVVSTASAVELAEAIHDAGYTPRQVEDEPAPSTQVQVRSGCGCGCATSEAAPADLRQAVAPASSSCCGW